jgi:multicomponent Na+:H+ antiporter subunit G
VRHAIALALVSLGTAVIVASAVGAAAIGRDAFNRLHFITPVTSLGAPLVAVGLSVQEGPGYTTAEILFIALLLFVAGPALESATARTEAQRRGLVKEEQPQ